MAKRKVLLIALITFGSWICSLGCSSPLSAVEEKFLGTWGTTLIDEEGVEVIVIWEFVFEYGTRSVVFNKIYRDNKIVSRRKGEWHIKASNHLRVVLDNEDLHISDNYENSNYSGHTLRSGVETVAAESGADERSIMAMTGHKTTQMVRRYIKEANIFKNNALNKIKI